MSNTPSKPRFSRPRLSPRKVAIADEENNDNEKVTGRVENVKKQYEVDEIMEEPKDFLSPMKRALLLLIFMLVCFFIVWQLRPFERVINAVLPDLNGTLHFDRTNASAWIESTDPTYKNAFAFQQCNGNATECCNGLENICDLRVNEIMFATLHKGTAAKEDGSFLNPNHLFSLESALKAGYRGLHLQVCNCGGKYEFCNGICHLGARNPTEVFLNIDRFVRDHPREVLLLKIELNSQVDQKVQLDKLYEIMSSSTKLVDKLYVHKKNEGRENNEENQWSTLRSMIRSNKRIVLFHSGGTTCNGIDAKSPCPKGMHYWHQYALESRADPEEITEPSNSKKSCFVRHSYQQPENVSTGEESEPRSQSGSSFFAVNNFIQTPDEKVSKMANAYSFLQDKVAVCSEKNPDMLVNIVSVDFWHHGDLVEFVQKENQRRGTLKSFLAV